MLGVVHMTTLTPDAIADLDSKASALLVELGVEWGSGQREILAKALKEEGDSRAAEKRERAACEAGLYDVAATIRGLPLTAEKGGGE